MSLSKVQLSLSSRSLFPSLTYIVPFSFSLFLFLIQQAM